MYLDKSCAKIKGIMVKIDIFLIKFKTEELQKMNNMEHSYALPYIAITPSIITVMGNSH